MMNIPAWKAIGIVITVLWSVVGSDIAWTEEQSYNLQETKEEILDALTSGEPKPTRRAKGRPPRGVSRLVPDNYHELVENPTARSLVLFDFDSATIKPESYPVLRYYGEILRDELPETTLVIAGHTDSAGSETYNLGLSQRRAQAVKEFLISMYEIDELRLIVQPYGETHPLETNETEEGRRVNRRVEFVRVN